MLNKYYNSLDVYDERNRTLWWHSKMYITSKISQTKLLTIIIL